MYTRIINLLLSHSLMFFALQLRVLSALLQSSALSDGGKRRRGKEGKEEEERQREKERERRRTSRRTRDSRAQLRQAPLPRRRLEEGGTEGRKEMKL